VRNEDLLERKLTTVIELETVRSGIRGGLVSKRGAGERDKMKERIDRIDQRTRDNPRRVACLRPRKKTESLHGAFSEETRGACRAF